MSVPIFIVDAFTTGDNSRFTGNPAAVCFLEFDDDIQDTMKQKIAMEMNLSETAFVSEGWIRDNPKLESDPSILRKTLRFFTPLEEVPLCGHATVATSKCLFEKNTANEIEFLSKFKGILGSVVNRETSLITLNFPANPTQKLHTTNNNWVGKIIEATLGSQLNSDVVQDLQYSETTKILLIRLKDDVAENGLLKVSPNFQTLLGIDTGKAVHDIIVTVKGLGNGKADFYSRFFSPWDGVDEDPVTGLAHTLLIPYWTRELGKEEGKDIKMCLAKQSSIRGGDLQCVLRGDRVQIQGRTKEKISGGAQNITVEKQQNIARSAKFFGIFCSFLPNFTICG